MKKSLLLVIVCSITVLRTFSQPTFPVNGAPYKVHSTYAFINANIFTDYETYIPNGVLLIKDGKVLSAGAKGPLPPGAIVLDLKGKYIYPSFIDIFTDYGIAPQKFDKKHQPGPQMETNVKGAYGWNQAIRAHIEAAKIFSHNAGSAEEFKKIGIGAVVSANNDGIVRGSGALVNLNSNRRENESVVLGKAAAFYSFSKGSSTQDYPTSLTGAIALLRQTYYDAKWYSGTHENTEFNLTLDEFNKLQLLPSIFEAGEKYNELRAARVGKEFNVKYIVKGAGNEYQRISEIRNTGLKFILPVNYPEPYDVEDPYEAERITLAELKHWELAPCNAAVMEKNNVPFCFTSADLKDKSAFLKNVRMAVKYGLSEKTALKALTANPALFISAYDRIGALRPGFHANFIICTKPVFDDESVIIQHWVAGDPAIYSDLEIPDLRGNYILKGMPESYQVSFTGEIARPKATIKIDTSKKEFSYNYSDNIITFSFFTDSTRVFRGSGIYNRENKGFEGRWQSPEGDWFRFGMNFISMVDTARKKKHLPSIITDLGKVIYPFTAYGQPLPGESDSFRESWNEMKGINGSILIKGATVWTNTADSALKEHDVLISGGKISRLGKALDVSGKKDLRIIDGRGMHLTPGLIDEHSHIAIAAGVNEAAEASSAEVRMGDVINPEDINIYRQLAGGVTTSQLLHGSANPIGGQSVLIKLRWGLGPEDLKFENADPFIKFALGENVKQSNWGDAQVVRFPQSRMGVEQVYYDLFTRAREYDRAVKAGPKPGRENGKGPPNIQRKDLELEALAEILNGRRFITCHSYVQSEVNMLMHVADSFNFKVNTFTHILEGYKVADKLKAHGANASTFSDWWAYKNEVMEAIPYNAAILQKIGVNTAINSDDAEMARRLNQEAAKCVKYGGLSEGEALKLVTLNPAKMLHIDKDVGSIVPGKSADLVLWSDHPLSVYARAEKTIIEGIVYYDRDEDKRLRESMRLERARIIAKMLVEKRKGNKVVKHTGRQPRLYYCNTIEGVDDALTGKR
jgi:imidazolonepropionase-like amidohydrolase